MTVVFQVSICNCFVLARQKLRDLAYWVYCSSIKSVRSPKELNRAKVKVHAELGCKVVAWHREVLLDNWSRQILTSSGAVVRGVDPVPASLLSHQSVQICGVQTRFDGPWSMAVLHLKEAFLVCCLSVMVPWSPQRFLVPKAAKMSDPD